MPRLLPCLLLLLLASAAKAADVPIYEQEPYDVIKLDDVNKNAVLKVAPLDFPDRQVPTKEKAGSNLEIRLLDRPNKVYRVDWSHIAEVKLFERIVLDEADALTAGGKFDEAYPYYQYLGRRYPKMQEFAASYEAYLLAGAAAAYKQGHFDEALALLWEIQSRNPRQNGLSPRICRVADKLMEQQFAEENYEVVRSILHELTEKLAEGAGPLNSAWAEKLTAKATALLTDAQEQFKAGHLRDAHRSCRQAIAVWPDVEGGKELSAAIEAKYPVVSVGVTALAAGAAASGRQLWAARRAARLTERSVAELSSLSAEGPTYNFPLAQFARSDGGRRITLTVRPDPRWSDGRRPVTGFDLARALVAQTDPANPSYRPGWKDLLAGVSVEGVYQVHVDLREPLFGIEPWLQAPVWPEYAPRPAGAPPLSLGPYHVESATDHEVRFVANDYYFAVAEKQPKEIVEHLYDDTAAALKGLARGEVTVVDHVGPWDAQPLADSQELAVEPYAIPTVHLLVFNVRRRYPANLLFRRAVAHAIDREKILRQDLSGGAQIPGSRVAESPFPKLNHEDASEAAAASRHFDPGLARTLAIAGVTEVITGEMARTGRSDPGAVSLVLAHPADEVSRFACRAIQRQMRQAGLPVKLVEIDPADPAAAAGADLIYVEWNPSEPVGDLSRLFGGDSLSGATSAVLDRLTRRWIAAPVAKGPERLRDIEQWIADDATLLPLWQLNDYLVYRRSLKGVGTLPVTLYQNVERWEVGR